jgi:hypothetical protein
VEDVEEDSDRDEVDALGILRELASAWRRLVLTES